MELDAVPEAGRLWRLVRRGDDLRRNLPPDAGGLNTINARAFSRFALRLLAAILGGVGLFLLWASWGGDNAAAALTAVIHLMLACGIVIGTP